MRRPEDPGIMRRAGHRYNPQSGTVPPGVVGFYLQQQVRPPRPPSVRSRFVSRLLICDFQLPGRLRFVATRNLASKDVTARYRRGPLRVLVKACEGCINKRAAYPRYPGKHARRGSKAAPPGPPQSHRRIDMSNLYVAHQGSGQDGQLYFTVTPDGSNWKPDQQVPTSGMSDSPSALFFNDRLYVFYQGSGEDGQLRYTSTSDTTDWAPDQQVPNVGMSAGPGARVGFNNRLYVFHQGSGQDGQLYFTSTPDGADWAQDQQIPTSGMSVGPYAAVFNDRLYVFYQGSGQDGQLYFTVTPDGSNWE